MLLGQLRRLPTEGRETGQATEMTLTTPPRAHTCTAEGVGATRIPYVAIEFVCRFDRWSDLLQSPSAVQPPANLPSDHQGSHDLPPTPPAPEEDQSQ